MLLFCLLMIMGLARIPCNIKHSSVSKTYCNGRSVVDEALNVDDLLRGERVFISALLGDELRHLLHTRIADATVQARQLVGL